MLSFQRKLESILDLGLGTREMKQAAVYILASAPYGTLYIGVTSYLQKRIWEHRNHVVEGFTSRNSIDRLVYYELHGDILSAIAREKRLKSWKRAWKIELIESMNPHWEDLYETLF